METTDIYLMIGGIAGIMIMLYAIRWQHFQHKKEAQEHTIKLCREIDKEAEKVYGALSQLKASIENPEAKVSKTNNDTCPECGGDCRIIEVDIYSTLYDCPECGKFGSVRCRYNTKSPGKPLRGFLY